MGLISKILGRNVKKWRSIRGMSQENLAFLLNVHSNTVGRFERGEHFCKPETLEKLSKILTVSPSELFEHNSKKFNIDNNDIVYKIGKELGVLSSDELEKVYNYVLSLKS